LDLCGSFLINALPQVADIEEIVYVVNLTLFYIFRSRCPYLEYSL